CEHCIGSLVLYVSFMPPALVVREDQTLMKDFLELDCLLKFADLFIVVLTTFNCWNQMIPYTIFGLSSLFSFQRSISSPCSNSYIISSSFKNCQAKLLKSFSTFC